MHGWKAFHYSAWSLRRKLFGYMLLLTMLLLLALVGGLLFFELFDSVEKRTHEALDIQLEIFEKDVSSHFENLAAAGLQLSHAISGYLDDYLAEEEIGLTALNDDTQRLEQIQREWIEPLQETMQKENCSGVFFMLDATVNSGVAGAEYSRVGLYLQRNGYRDSADESLLLYRGPAELGKEFGIMPHRKWRLEFRTDLFPNYRELCACAEKTHVESYLLTDRFVLPGTSDEAVLMTAPIVGADGVFYGVCGYEVSTSYFTAYHAQPTKLSSLTCMVVPDGDTLDAQKGLFCGSSDGCGLVPDAQMTMEQRGSLATVSDGDTTYIGLLRHYEPTPNNPPFLLAVMIRQSDYDREIAQTRAQFLVLLALLGFFCVSCCLFFSRRYLSPILRGLEKLKSDAHTDAQTEIPEIDDLFRFLAEKDRDREDALSVLLREKELAQAEKERLQREFAAAQNQYETARAEIARLAYDRKNEIDPADYRQFLEGIDRLTPTERRIFDYYLSGKSVKEIIEIAGIKESTLRYHNQNIYGKLGVNSLKQLLRCAALMHEDEQNPEK
ncbi:MAG: hypothetical protein E7452_10620 [Ruminococcaceae bacterium]|nr:hypothetical protein [Oscillospiraceae bacterium]